jgi:hypothetical protein
MLSVHAKKRCKQRAIPIDLVNVALIYGEEFRRHKADVLWLSKESIKQMIADGFNSSFACRCSDIYIVLVDSIIITVAHKSKRFKR